MTVLLATPALVLAVLAVSLRLTPYLCWLLCAAASVWSVYRTWHVHQTDASVWRAVSLIVALISAGAYLIPSFLSRLSWAVLLPTLIYLLLALVAVAATGSLLRGHGQEASREDLILHVICGVFTAVLSALLLCGAFIIVNGDVTLEETDLGGLLMIAVLTVVLLALWMVRTDSVAMEATLREYSAGSGLLGGRLDDAVENFADLRATQRLMVPLFVGLMLFLAYSGALA